MGIAGLWAELAPARRSTSLAEMRGRSVAIDLSIWICESMALFDQQKALHRKLMLKVIQLVHFGIFPVFVVDGISPKMKAETIRKRREQRQRAAGGDEHVDDVMAGDGGHLVGGGSGMFAWILEEWKVLLAQLGLPVVQSVGEAEATCAQLNARGLVDGCVTKDGDSFLFGAKQVYAKFSCDPSARKQEQMCVYDMSDVEKEAGYSREDLVAMALLVGSDYGGGVKNVAWEKAKDLRRALDGSNLLERMQGWRTNQTLEEIGTFKEMSKPAHCTYCGHEGNRSKHRKDGCDVCETTELCVTGRPCLCDYHQREQKYDSNAVEINVRRKALEDLEFPSQEIISAFLHPAFDENVDLTWRRPNFSELKNFIETQFMQPEEKACELTLKYLTGHDLQLAAKKAGADPATCKSQPDHIIKAKKENGVDMLQIEWKTIEGVPADMGPLLTTESQAMFTAVFPDMVKTYETDIEEMRNEAVRKPKGKRPRPDSKQRTLDSMRPVRRRLDFSSPSRKKLDFGKSVGQPASTASSGAPSDIMVYIDSDSGDELPSTSKTGDNCARKSPRKVTNSSVMDKSEFKSTVSSFLVKSAAHSLPCSVSECPDCLETRSCDSAPASMTNSSPDTTPKKDNKRKTGITQYYSMRKKSIVTVGKPSSNGQDAAMAVPVVTPAQRKTKTDSAAKPRSAKTQKDKLPKSGPSGKRMKVCKNQSSLDRFLTTKHLR